MKFLLDSQKSLEVLNRFIILMALVLLVSIAGFSWHSWIAEKNNQIQNLQNIMEIGNKAIDSYLFNIEQDMNELGHGLTCKSASIDLEAGFIQLKRFLKFHPDLFNVTVIREDGRILFTGKTPPDPSLPTVASEPSFIEFREGLKNGKLENVGRPLEGVISNEWIIPIRFAIKNIDGKPDYIISANLSIAILEGFWKHAPFTKSSFIGLIRDDGYLISRYPTPSKLEMATIYEKPRTGTFPNYLRNQRMPESGCVEGRSSIDGRIYLTTFHRLEHFPITLYIAMPLSDIRQGWMEKVWVPLLLTVFLLFGAFVSYRIIFHLLYTRESERRHAEEALSESEKRFRAAFMCSPVAIAITTLEEGTWVDANAAEEETFGYPREELLSKDAQSGNLWVDKNDRIKFVEAIEHKGMIRNQIVQLRRKDGSLITASVSANLLNIKGKKHIIFTTEDITERKRTEGLLKASEERFRILTENSLQGIGVQKGIPPVIIYVNPRWTEIFGYSSEEVLSFAPEDTWKMIHPDDCHMVRQRNHERLCGKSVIPTYEFRIIRKDGSIRWVEVFASKIPSETETLVMSTYVDITERKRAEEALQEERWRLQSIIKGTRDGTWELNVQTGELIVNEMWAKTLGYSLDELMPFTSDDWAKMVHPDDLNHALEAMARHFSRQQEYYSCEFRMKHKNGHWIWIEDNGQVITCTADGGPLMMFGSHTDITDRKLAEEQINRNLKEKETMLKEIHHRVKNNLAVITSLLGLQANRVQDALIKDILEVCQNRIKSMAMIHEKLYQSENLSSVNFSEYIQRIVGDLAASYQLGKRTIRFNIDAQDIFLDINMAIPCGLIINELITNALKHAFNGISEPELNIRFHQSGEVYSLTVQDNGTGMPEDPDANTLGVMLVRALTRQLRGNVIFQSSAALRQGTAVIVRFNKTNDGK